MRLLRNLCKGIKAAYTGFNAFTTFILSLAFFIFLALTTSVNYSLQMFSAGPEYWLTAIIFTVKGFYLNGGWFNVVLNVFYALITGALLNNAHTQFKVSGVNLENFSGIAPGMLVAGCAGCGVGLLSLTGASGIILSLPFQGTGIKVGGILLLLVIIARIGDPETCAMDAS